MKNVVVLGGGIAGVEAAIMLRKKGFDVTLVSNRSFLYVYPVSIWIPTRQIDFDDAIISLEDLAKVHDYNLIIDYVQSIDIDTNTIMLEQQKLKYDYLVIAVGADKIQTEGIENTLSICGKPDDAIKLRDRYDELIKKGSGKIAFGFGGNPKDSSAVRGGPAYELIFNTVNYLEKKGLRDKFEITFFAPMANPGAKMGKKALESNDKFFKKLKVETRIGKKIKRFDEDGVVFEDDSKLDSDLVMFIPASTGKNMLDESGLPLSDAGFVKINQFCQVEGFTNIFAIGDIASLEGPDWRAKQGHVAEVMARVTADNINAIEQNKNNLRSYIEHVNILCVMDTGKGAAFIYRDIKREMMLPMPIIGHWLKKGWRHYYRLTKLKKIPRIPGM